jgi:hypothetical protein
MMAYYNGVAAPWLCANDAPLDGTEGMAFEKLGALVHLSFGDECTTGAMGEYCCSGVRFTVPSRLVAFCTVLTVGPQLCPSAEDEG